MNGGDQFNSETDCMVKIPCLKNSPVQFANVSYLTSRIPWSFPDSFSFPMISTDLGRGRVVWLSNEILSRNTRHNTQVMTWIGFKPRLFHLEGISLMYSSCLSVFPSRQVCQNYTLIFWFADGVEKLFSQELRLIFINTFRETHTFESTRIYTHTFWI